MNEADVAIPEILVGDCHGRYARSGLNCRESNSRGAEIQSSHGGRGNEMTKSGEGRRQTRNKCPSPGVVWVEAIMKRTILFAVVLLFTLAACAPATFTEGQTISWAQAVDLLHAGQVTMVVQLHSLEVHLTLRSGVTVITVEPTIDAIFDEIQRCSAPCANIVQATE